MQHEGDVALAVLNMILMRISDPRLSDELGTTRREAIDTAIRIWARGALRNRGELKVLPKR
ncbi:MAG: hypothetical protein OEZ06_03565 [Myxococcales bacterium]|nr:hypothetical protein [Myxococcales bacterium]